MKRPQYVFRPNLNEPQHRRAWALLQQMPPAKRKEFLVQSILAAEQTNRLEKSIRKVAREELQAVNITSAVPSPLPKNIVCTQMMPPRLKTALAVFEFWRMPTQVPTCRLI